MPTYYVALYYIDCLEGQLQYIVAFHEKPDIAQCIAEFYLVLEHAQLTVGSVKSWQYAVHPRID